MAVHAFLGLDFLDGVDVGVSFALGVVGLHRGVGVDVAQGAVVVGADLDPVVDAAENDVGGEDVGDCAVVKDDVDGGEVVDVVVVAADVAFVAESWEAGDGVGVGRDLLGGGWARRCGRGLRHA